MKIHLPKLFVGMVLILICFSSRAQIPLPTYTCSISNAKIVSPSEYEFDVIMQRTGNIDIKLSHFQMGIRLNPEIIPEGATITIASVPGSSALSGPQQPGPERFSFESKTKSIRITAVPPVRAYATTISALPGGTRIFRIRVTCSQPFNTGISTNHIWNFSFTTGYGTKIFALVGGPMYENTDITNQSSHIKSTSSPADVTFTK